MSGYLIMLNRGLDDEPVRLVRDRDAALRLAGEIAASIARIGDATVEGKPRTGRGELGPPGVISFIIGISVFRFRRGVVVPSETVRVRIPARSSAPA